MGKIKTSSTSDGVRKPRPALTPEGREQQLVSLAVNLAERQLIDGTASSQVISHYLKIGSTKERIEKEILEKQKDLIDAKTQALQSAQRIEELYKIALEAMRNYGGHGDADDY
jgi:EAL domain-containing protein (putative c-di-GMP-specific phosphodiesterase class I)